MTYISKLAIYINNNKISSKDINHIKLNDNLSTSEAQFFNGRIFFMS